MTPVASTSLLGGELDEPPLVAVEGLHVGFGRPCVEVVAGISFSVARGECLAIVGESGSGKSVTSRALVGLAGFGATVTFDRLEFDGDNAGKFSERDWRHVRGTHIGFVLQDALSSLDALRVIGKEIAEPLKLHTTMSTSERDAKVIELLRSVGVPEPEVRALQYPHELSGGLRQRALIASAIACDPELLIADEPTTALDVSVQAEVLELLESLKTKRRGLLVVSHNLAVVARLADRVAVMRSGRIVETGTIEEVLHNPSSEYTKSLLAAVPSSRTRGRRLSSASDDATYIGAHPLPLFASGEVEASGDVPAVLEGAGLTKIFTGPDKVDRTVVADVSFRLAKGEALGIVGASGSGKTTTARLVLGLETPNTGEVLWHGRPYDSLTEPERRAARRRYQFVYQDPLSSFDPRYTVEKVIGEALTISGYRDRDRRARTLELLALVRLDAGLLKRRPIEMSGGQRQRVAIARALAPEPEVLVLDEPVSALDVSVQARILDLLIDLRTTFGVSYLFISHDLGVVHHLCDRVLVMKAGQVVEEGPIDDVFNRPVTRYTRELLDAIPTLGAVGAPTSPLERATSI